LLDSSMCAPAGQMERQEEFSQQMEEAREGVLQEEAEEARNPTVEEFMQGAEEEESSVGTESD
jgi:hypothetical protein